MKFVVIFAAVIVGAVGSTIPLVPKNNRHYVKGVNRFGKGDILADLHEPDNKYAEKSKQSIQYWLYTRRNLNVQQRINNNDAGSIISSNFDATRPLKVIIHDFTDNGNSEMNQILTSAWLAVMDANIIVVDWSELATAGYVTALKEAPATGHTIGAFITWLFNTAGGDWNNVHITGFGLGGQIAGNAGRACGGRIRRFTGLNPIGPFWYNNPDAAGRNDAQYVEFIFTHYHQPDPPLNGHADFYVNGGFHQPGCTNSRCSERRSYQLFAISIRDDNFVGRECISVEETRSATNRRRCTGPPLNMGNSNLDKKGSGIFAVTVTRQWPY